MAAKYQEKQIVWYQGKPGRVLRIAATVDQKTITRLYTIKFFTGEIKSVLEKHLNT